MGTHVDPQPVGDGDAPGAGEPKTESWSDTARSFAAYGHTGMMFPVAITLGGLGGYFLDGWLGTRPWLALLGGALGVVTAMRHLFRTVARQDAREREAQSREVQALRDRRRRNVGPGNGIRHDRDSSRDPNGGRDSLR